MKVSAKKKEVTKKVIAKKPLTNLYEMNSSMSYTFMSAFNSFQCKPLRGFQPSCTQYPIYSVIYFLSKCKLCLDFVRNYKSANVEQLEAREHNEYLCG